MFISPTTTETSSITFIQIVPINFTKNQFFDETPRTSHAVTDLPILPDLPVLMTFLFIILILIIIGAISFKICIYFFEIFVKYFKCERVQVQII